MLQKFTPIFTVGMIFTDINASASILSFVSFILLCIVLRRIITFQYFYSYFYNIFQTTLHFLCCTCTGTLTKAKNVKSKVSTTKSFTDEYDRNLKLLRGDVEIIMGKLGIFCDPNGDKLQERISAEDISMLFDETEPSLEEVKEAFVVFDENSDGFIDAKELERVFCRLGFTEISEVKCHKMIMAFDDNGDERIDFTEFLKVVEAVNFCPLDHLT